MKSLRKLLAVVVALALMATFMIPSFAETALTDAEICETLGMLQGAGEGVTEEYLASTPTRMQAAIMFLRLQGLEEEALAYEGEDNFDDADLVWEGGQAILAYLKANPDLGWQGIGNNLFDPLSPITAQQYYKVMLTVLGYEQGVDFEWEEVLDFAADVGLSAVADVEEFTVNDLAIATVEALRAEVAEGGQTLIERMVEEGIVAEEDAQATGLIESELALVGLTVADSKTLAVTFDRALTDEEKAATTVTFKKDGVAIAVGAVSWDGAVAKFKKVDDSKLLAGTYEATVTGFDPVSVTYAGETITSIAIATSRIKDAASQKLVVTGKNQFGEGVDVSKTSLTVVAYNKTSSTSLGTIADIDNIDISAQTALNDVIQFTAYLTATPSVMIIKDVKVDNFYLGTIALGDPVVPADQARITVGQAAVQIPYTATDNGGESYVIPACANEAAIETATNAIVNLVNITGISVDANNKLFVDLTGSAAGTATIQFINTMTGTVFTKSFTINAVAALDSVTMAVPSGTTYAVGDAGGEITLSGIDNYGVARTNAQLLADFTGGKIGLSSSNQAVIANASLAVNGSGKVTFVPAGAAGTTTIFATVGAKVATVTVQVNAARYTKEISVKTAPATNLVQGGAVTKIQYQMKDQYGAAWPDANLAGYKVNLALSKVSGDDGGVTLSVYGDMAESAVVGDDIIITSVAGKTGTYKLTAKIIKEADGSVVSSVETTVNVIADNAAGLTIAVEAIPTLHKIAGADFASEYSKTVSIYGVDAGGQRTVFPLTSFIGLTSSNPGVAPVQQAIGNMKVCGIAAGTATLTAVVNTADGIKTVQAVVTVSDEALVPQAIAVQGTNVDTTNKTLTIAEAAINGLDLDNAAALNFKVTDQFGGTSLEAVAYLITNITDANVVAGQEFTAADIAVGNDGVITVGADAASGDTFKITAVTSNGLVETVKITIQ